MTLSQSKNIGGKVALKGISFGVLTGYFLFSLFFLSVGGGPQSFLILFEVNYLPNILVGVAGMYLVGFLLGRLAGYEILIKKNNCSLVGIKYSILTLLLGCTIGCCVKFFQEGIHNLKY